MSDSTRNICYTNTYGCAAKWGVRARRLNVGLRAAMGASAGLVYQRRKQLLEETIYNRPPTDRPLTGNLRNSEFIVAAGPGMQVGNRAKYAVYRHPMTGISKTYPHLLDSFWAKRAINETASQRRTLIRRANREALRAGS